MNSTAVRERSRGNHSAYGDNEDSRDFTVHIVTGRHPYHPKFLDESDISVESIEYEVFAEDQQYLQY